MRAERPRVFIEMDYDRAAAEYQSKLPLEHYMEATTQSKQREITLESLALVHAQRPEVQIFNELLVQYPRRGKKLGQVVPDNMVVIHPEPIKAVGSYNLPLQPAWPFWVLEYVSRSNRRKDYEDNFHKYERELKVPYYLVFHPEAQEMTLYRHNGRKYVAVKPNEHGRYALPELELEVALLDGWVRFWFRGELLPLPAELLRQLREKERQLQEADQRAESERQARQAAEAELARLRAELEQLRRPPRPSSPPPT
jgi:Uma2 family endonuclease